MVQFGWKEVNYNMLNSLKRIREQQSLSVDFVSSVLNIDTTDYIEFESGNKLIRDEMMSKIIRLFGVEARDLYPENEDIDVSKIGLARAYSSITEKDKVAISKLISFRKNINKKG